MWSPDLEAEWSGLTERILAEMKEWRAAHPRATLTDIEQEIDARMADARARLLAAMAAPGDEAAPCCPDCGAAMRWEGTRARRLTTTHNRNVTLPRRYARCPQCGTGLSPPWMRRWGCGRGS